MRAREIAKFALGRASATFVLRAEATRRGSVWAGLKPRAAGKRDLITVDMFFNRRLVAALLAYCAALTLGGCGRPTHAELLWEEPVALATGEVVRIVRHVKIWQERGYKGEFMSAATFDFSTIDLVGETSKFPTWNAPLVPILLEKDPANSEWVIIASSDGCSMWDRNGRPRPPYWAFRLREGKWYRDVIPDVMLGRRANLLVQFDVNDNSADLNAQIESRKKIQLTKPDHPVQFTSVDATYEKHCDRAPTQPIGQNELDLKNFGSLK